MQQHDRKVRREVWCKGIGHGAPACYNASPLCSCTAQQPAGWFCPASDSQYSYAAWPIYLCSLLLFAGRPGRCFYRHMYLPDQAMFTALPADLGFGAYAEPPQQPVQLALLPDGTGFIKKGVEYRWVPSSCYLTIHIQSPGRIAECAIL
jgi:hypothetical protein